jgi:predicted MPP superfamily phosphohydrolase
MPPDSSSPGRFGRRIVYFLTVVLGILLAGNALVCATANYFLHLPHRWIWTAAAFVLTFGFVAASILGRFTRGWWSDAIYRVCAIWLGFLNYFLFASIAAWIIYLTKLDREWIGIVCFGAAIVVSLYGLVNAATIRVTPVTVKLAHLPAEWQERTLALVTDVHLGNMRGLGFSRRVVRKLEAIRPEMVCISGDLFDGPEADYPLLMRPWKAISSLVPVYFVTGNHEEFSDRRKYLKAVEGAGIHILNNEKVEFRGMQIVGVHDEEIHDPEHYRALLQGAQIDRNRASILLVHQALHLEIPREAGIGLLLSGHTHGGQFWPWIYVAKRVHGRFNHGLNRVESLQVFTGNGVGTWGAPMRVGTKSQIVLIRLQAA